MNWRVPLANLGYGAEEEIAVQNVLKSRWLTMGAITQDFEAQFAAYLGVNYAIAVSNATAALHLACNALGIGPGDEVIVPSLSFVATSNAVLYTGADVCFAEIHGENDLTISPASIEKQITPRTKAIIVMHYGGYPCEMPRILEIARDHNLYVIEDAAHAPGSLLDGKALGTWSDVACFSFFSNKNLSTGEGGILVTDQIDIAEKIRLMRSHGMTSLTWDRHQGHAYSYDVTTLGYNYRFDEIRAALGLIQLGKLSKNNARRREISQQYILSLSDTDITIPFINAVGTSANHIFPILLPINIKRQAVIDFLRDEKIQTSIHYPPIHQFSYYRQRYPNFNLPVTDEIAHREITLPLFPEMTDDMVNLVVSSLKNSLKSQL